MTGSFWEYFLFYGLTGFYITWLEGVCHPLVQDSLRFSPEFRRQFQFILSHQLLTWKPRFCFFTRSSAWDSPVRSRWPLSSKLISFFLFPLRKKKATSAFRVLANHLASFFFPHTVRRFVRTTISSTRVRLRGTDSLTYIFYFLQLAGRSWPTFLIPLLTVRLWRPVNSNTEG